METFSPGPDTWHAASQCWASSVLSKHGGIDGPLAGDWSNCLGAPLSQALTCDSTGLCLNFLGSRPSSAAPMSLLRNDDKVFSTSLKSEWTCQTGPGCQGWGCSGPTVGGAFLACSGLRAHRPEALGRAGRAWEGHPQAMLHVVLSVSTPGSCRAWSSCQTVSCTSSCKASSQCPR